MIVVYAECNKSKNLDITIKSSKMLPVKYFCNEFIVSGMAVTFKSIQVSDPQLICIRIIFDIVHVTQADCRCTLTMVILQ